jgi:hypothetical protein
VTGSIPSLTLSGSYGVSGSYPSAQSPAGKALRLLKTQLGLAVGQREEDPERAWLELVSVRERLDGVVEAARGDELLLKDVQRFRGKLEEQLSKLTRDVGDDVVAPLYSWVDLLRQRARLEDDVQVARVRVAEARAARGAMAVEPPASEGDATAAFESAEHDLRWWRVELPPPPPLYAHGLWEASGADALRPALSLDPQVVRARGIDGRRILSAGVGRFGGYAGSKLELVLLPSIAAAALLVSMFAFASAGMHAPLGAVAVLAWSGFGAAVTASVFTRRRVEMERRAAIDVVWHHLHFTEQVAALDLEAGWLRTLAAALRARRVFDAHEFEGGQLAELAAWRPDLEPIVVDVAKSNATL